MAKPVDSFTVHDVAHRAGVSESTVRADIQKRRLDTVRDATGHVWIPRAATSSYRAIPYLERGEQLLSYRDTAAKLHVSEKTVVRFKQRGWLEVVEVSPHRFLVRADAPCLALDGKSITEWASGNPAPRVVSDHLRDRVHKMLPSEADARRWGTSRQKMFEAALRARGRFMNARAAAGLLGLRRVKTFYEWRRRHHVPRYGRPERARFLEIDVLRALLAELQAAGEREADASTDESRQRLVVALWKAVAVNPKTDDLVRTRLADLPAARQKEVSESLWRLAAECFDDAFEQLEDAFLQFTFAAFDAVQAGDLRTARKIAAAHWRAANESLRRRVDAMWADTEMVDRLRAGLAELELARQALERAALESFQRLVGEIGADAETGGDLRRAGRAMLQAAFTRNGGHHDLLRWLLGNLDQALQLNVFPNATRGPVRGPRAQARPKTRSPE